MNELEVLEYRHDKLSDHLDRIEERHDRQIMILESEVARLKAEVEQLKSAQTAPEE